LQIIYVDGGFSLPPPVTFSSKLKGHNYAPKNSKTFEAKNCSKLKINLGCNYFWYLQRLSDLFLLLLK